jgi:hypothetical protein
MVNTARVNAIESLIPKRGEVDLSGLLYDHEAVEFHYQRQLGVLHEELAKLQGPGYEEDAVIAAQAFVKCASSEPGVRGLGRGSFRPDVLYMKASAAYCFCLREREAVESAYIAMKLGPDVLTRNELEGLMTTMLEHGIQLRDFEAATAQLSQLLDDDFGKQEPEKDSNMVR